MQYFAVFSEKGIVFRIFTLHASLSNLKTSVNLVYGNTAQWGKEIRREILPQAKGWKMWEYFVYFPFFILHDWVKRSAEARCPHCAVLP